MKPTYSITNVNRAISINVGSAHDSATTMAQVECYEFTGDIGSSIEISLGYDGSNTRVFSGYVKSLTRAYPESTWKLSCQDKMIRAADYTIVAVDPEVLFTRKNILAEYLVRDLMLEAGLGSYTFDPTSFTIATKTELEIDMVSSYDYSKMIADLLTWSLWCDPDGIVHFENRKPYVMYGTSGQLGDEDPDTTKASVFLPYTLLKSSTTGVSYTLDDRNLRNRVVVRGADVAGAEASASSIYLPSGYYKTAVLSSPQLIQDTSVAQMIADYNLDFFNRISKVVGATVIGDPTLEARKVITGNIPSVGIETDSLWYIRRCEHTMSKQGYTTVLELTD